MLSAAGITNELVEWAASGSRRDLERLLESLQPQIRVMVVARLSPTPAQSDLVEDIVQEVSMGLAAGVGHLRTRTIDGLRAFLSSIADKQVALFLRKQGRQRPAGGALQSLDSTIAACSTAGPLWEFLSSSGTSPLSAADRADWAARILTELGRLQDRYREVITLAFFDQLTPGEIGPRMGLSREAASMLLLRAVRTLRGNMAGEARPENACGTPR